MLSSELLVSVILGGGAQRGINSPSHGMACVSTPEPGRNKGWTDMTHAEKSAAMQLGFDEELWDAGETPAPCCQSWASLSKDETQLAAAMHLGYSQEIWDLSLIHI